MNMRLVKIILLSFVCTIIQAQDKNAVLTIDASNLRTKINKNIYGQFSEHLGHCIYGGIWVGEDSKIPNTHGIRNDVVTALKRINVPVLRWPGGCFADEYHWKDGIGPRDKRPTMINTTWGGVTENNSFGTHEFLELCNLIGSEPYISGNVGSGTVQELSQWVEYVNSDNVCPMTDLRRQNGREKSWGVHYWAIGNESWGCGGNMRAEYYSDLARRFGTYMRDYGSHKVFKIACGPSDDNYQWTETMMKNAGDYIQGLSLHHYSSGDGTTAENFDETGWFNILKKSLTMDELISRHSAIMNSYDPYKRVALIVDEWGLWHSVEPGTNPAFLYQQNTLRDAITAASTLNIFNNHCDRVRMANIAQMINVLQAMILTQDEKMIVTPTFHVFDMYKIHQNALFVKTEVTSPAYIFHGDKLAAINASASIDNQGLLHITLCNIDPVSRQNLHCTFKKYSPTSVTGQILTAEKMNAYNTFQEPHNVQPEKFTDATLKSSELEVTLPPKSVVVLELQGKHEMAPSVILKQPVSGISYEYYEGKWEHLPCFDSLTAKYSGIENNFIIPDKNSGENFGIRYTGYIKIPKDGFYTFYTNSDDGTILSIDSTNIVVNDGQHAPQEQSGDVMLNAGFHSIQVLFFQGGGGKVLDVSLEGPGFEKQFIPAEILFHERKGQHE